MILQNSSLKYYSILGSLLKFAPEALQIVATNDNDETIILNEKVLEYILTKDEIKDRYVSIISIAGVSRQGKSFLMNFLLRYLQVKYVIRRNVGDWLRAEDGPLQGFSFAPGSKRHTTGILMWSEVFLTQLETGEKVAVILLDTQGSFDMQSSVSDCGKIFALSTLISSVQVYNVMRNIKQYDLTHLQCFGGYGKLLSNTGTTPFQNLTFLVRDWPYPHEKPYGSVGGNLLLTEILLSNNASEVQEQSDNVKELFNEINCFLLPYPGRIVDTCPNFNGCLEDVGGEFKKYAKEFVLSILAPENLALKTIHGEKVRAGDLVHYIKEYCKILKEGALPQVQTVYHATLEAHYKAALQRAIKQYRKIMDADHRFNPKCYTPVQLYEKHSLTKIRAVEYYGNIRKFEDSKMSETYLLQLKNALDDAYKEYIKINDRKLRAEELSRKRAREQAERFTRRVDYQRPGTSKSDTATLNAAQIAGTAVAVVGGIAALAFGASKLFTKSNND